MSISGMTGFARAEGVHAGLRWVWEAKSVNGRGLDLKLRMPSGFDAIEPLGRIAAQARFKRGSVQASLTLARDPAQAPALRIDANLDFAAQRQRAPRYVDTKRRRRTPLVFALGQPLAQFIVGSVSARAAKQTQQQTNVESSRTHKPPLLFLFLMITRLLHRREQIFQ